MCSKFCQKLGLTIVVPCLGNASLMWTDRTVLILTHRWVLSALQPKSHCIRQLRMASAGGHGNEVRRIQCSQRLTEVREGARDGAQTLSIYLSSVCVRVRWHRWRAEDTCKFALLPPRGSVVSLRPRGLDGCVPHCWAVWPVPVRIFNMLFIPWRMSTGVTVDVWRAEDRLQELILSFQHMDSWPKTSWFYILAK